jgi:hypothetical protein
MRILSANLAKHAAMNKQVCRLEIIQLQLATQHRWSFVAVTLTGSEPLAAADEVANQLRHKPLIGMIRLLHEQFELNRGLGNLRDASRADIQPENTSLSVSNQPAPLLQEAIAVAWVEADR